MLADDLPAAAPVAGMAVSAEVLQQLAPAQRSCIILKDVLDHSLEGAAKSEGISRTTGHWQVGISCQRGSTAARSSPRCMIRATHGLPISWN
jgi:hypothetical protein